MMQGGGQSNRSKRDNSHSDSLAGATTGGAAGMSPKASSPKRTLTINLMHNGIQLGKDALTPRTIEVIQEQLELKKAKMKRAGRKGAGVKRSQRNSSVNTGGHVSSSEQSFAALPQIKNVNNTVGGLRETLQHQQQQSESANKFNMGSDPYSHSIQEIQDMQQNEKSGSKTRKGQKSRGYFTTKKQQDTRSKILAMTHSSPISLPPPLRQHVRASNYVGARKVSVPRGTLKIA